MMSAATKDIGGAGKPVTAEVNPKPTRADGASIMDRRLEMKISKFVKRSAATTSPATSILEEDAAMGADAGTDQ